MLSQIMKSVLPLLLCGACSLSAALVFPNPSLEEDADNIGCPDGWSIPKDTVVKLVRDKAEQARVAIRNIRRKAKDDLDSLKEVGEDEISRAEKELDATTKQHVDAIDDAVKRKEAELLEV